jgi:hypothetical protein
VPAPTPSPYRIVLGYAPQDEKPWICEIWLKGEHQGTVAFEDENDRNDFMRQYQEPGDPGTG